MQRAALLFFGKHSDGGRSQNMKPDVHASSHLIQNSHSSWINALIRPNQRKYKIDVFAHSWSLEVAQMFDEIWKPYLKISQHESTLYKNNLSKTIDAHCIARQINCERTISQLLSMKTVIDIKIKYEILKGFVYDVCFVARHDLTFTKFIKLPPQVPENTISFAQDCGSCKNLKGCKVLDSSCLVSNNIPRQTYFVIDWFFLASSSTTNSMAKIVENFHTHSRALKKIWYYSGTHWIWPYHALKMNIAINFDMPVINQVDMFLTRSNNARVHRVELGTEVARSLNLRNITKYNHPEALSRQKQCPYHRGLACPTESNGKK